MGNLTIRQTEIVEKAIILISEKGIQHLTIKNLAERMNVSEPALYRHFKSKMDILLAILTMFREKSRDIIPEAENVSVPSSVYEDTLNTLKLFFLNHIALIEKNRTLAAVIFSEEIFQNEKKLADSVFSIMENRQKIIISLISSGQKKKSIRNDIEDRQISVIIIGSLRFLVTRWRLSGFSFDLEAEGKELWNSIEKIIKF